jgi:hypothetical protein
VASPIVTSATGEEVKPSTRPLALALHEPWPLWFCSRNRHFSNSPQQLSLRIWVAGAHNQHRVVRSRLPRELDIVRGEIPRVETWVA